MAESNSIPIDPLDSQEVLSLVHAARVEDLGSSENPVDITSTLLELPQRRASFNLLLKEPGVVAGLRLCDTICRIYDDKITVEHPEGVCDGWHATETRTVLARIEGRADTILAAERVILNFMQRLFGIASLTRRFVDEVAGTDARIYDTRKTTPGWRALEKYAVTCGGGHNHRFGLFDAVLLKDNHLAGIPTHRLAGEVFGMLNRLAQMKPRPRFVEIEADTMEQVAELFKVVGIDIVLLDNFSLSELREAVQMRDDLGLRGKIELEASGGITLDTARDVAATGVDRISVGALTHSVKSVDLSLERNED